MLVRVCICFYFFWKRFLLLDVFVIEVICWGFWVSSNDGDNGIGFFVFVVRGISGFVFMMVDILVRKVDRSLWVRFVLGIFVRREFKIFFEILIIFF